MKVEESQAAAVLTGDIVKSRKQSSDHPKALGILLREAAKAAAATFPEAGISKIDIFRGDSWQVLVREREHALRVALFIRSYLRGGEGRNRSSWETRLGIGLGTVEWVDEKQISQSQGPAFVASGAALDSLSGSKRHMVLQQAGDTEKDLTGQTVVSLLDAVVQRWTPRQAWAVNGALREDWTQEQIGQTFVPPLKQRTVADHLRRADWDAVERALRWWQEEWR